MHYKDTISLIIFVLSVLRMKVVFENLRCLEFTFLC